MSQPAVANTDDDTDSGCLLAGSSFVCWPYIYLNLAPDDPVERNYIPFALYSE